MSLASNHSVDECTDGFFPNSKMPPLFTRVSKLESVGTWYYIVTIHILCYYACIYYFTMRVASENDKCDDVCAGTDEYTTGEY